MIVASIFIIVGMFHFIYILNFLSESTAERFDREY